MLFKRYFFAADAFVFAGKTVHINHNGLLFTRHVHYCHHSVFTFLAAFLFGAAFFFVLALFVFATLFFAVALFFFAAETERSYAGEYLVIVRIKSQHRCAEFVAVEGGISLTESVECLIHLIFGSIFDAVDKVFLEELQTVIVAAELTRVRHK